MTAAAPYAVPRLWPGCTIVLLGDGPSLTPEDVSACRGRARVLAMNYSFRLAPWADVLWSYHTEGLLEYSGVDLAAYGGRVFSLEPKPAPWPVLLKTGGEGLELQPTGVRHGNNSGYGAINLAVHLGARRIVLLGYDCQAAQDGTFNWAKDADHPSRPAYNFGLWLKRYATLVDPLKALGIEVLNASRRTALTCFPYATLEQALAGAELGSAA